MYEDFMDIYIYIFLGHHKIGLYLGVFYMHFRYFLKVKAHILGGGGGC